MKVLAHLDKGLYFCKRDDLPLLIAKHRTINSKCRVMINVEKVASYIFNRYEEERHTKIDEMKLHKLLYFSQRESIIRTGSPMFEESFAAWKYGPVVVKVRNLYKSNKLNELPSSDELAPFKETLDFVFQTYAVKNAWTLSILTHGESSWQKARKGCSPEDHCDNLLDIEDIRRDAERMRIRRFYFDKIVPQIEASK